ncbi:hypothetical protein H6G00_14915 [Leptolyngbya sp. FACHB-541]|uniref:hypothetical protein n=1 Tax=Leptolyngbya sp. FACHB-541 TaxID=2692810 RepID=UPI001684028C|nr:hypothetical protein [Leptolyngbya sp. FACHB-541]MBD1997900.1 hypothetical protein [Leptolyngbya sp. FACHB-541]
MKRLLLAIGLTSLMIPSNAIAQEVCGNSYVILPDGSCMNMSYLTVLGQARQTRAAVNEAYQQQFNANVLIELDPYYIETEQERDNRYQSLAESSIIRDDVNATADDIESTLFPIHTEAMSVIGEAYR